MAGGGSGDGGANNQPTDPGGNDTVGNVLGNFWGGGGGGCIKLINCKEVEERANLNPRHHVHHWWDDLDAALKAIFHGKTTSKPK